MALSSIMPKDEASLNEKVPLLTTSGKKGKYALVIHGGAGIMSRDKFTPEIEAQYKYMLSVALRAGHGILSNGGEAMDAAVAAVSVMEGLILAISHALLGHSDCDP
jgi:L-asparaginase / beta-aspartyl-peptidase